jgi:hypothetical protein
LPKLLAIFSTASRILIFNQNFPELLDILFIDA